MELREAISIVRDAASCWSEHMAQEVNGHSAADHIDAANDAIDAFLALLAGQ